MTKKPGDDTVNIRCNRRTHHWLHKLRGQWYPITIEKALERAVRQAMEGEGLRLDDEPAEETKGG